MRERESIKYIDYRGIELPDHDGTMIEIEDVGYQFFDINGKGFIHDGSRIKLPDGRSQFFLHDGRAIIHDGSPLEMPTGRMQYFDHEGIPFLPIDEKRLTPLFTKQRDLFFEDRINHINKQTPLEKNEVEELRLALLAAEHPDYVQQSIQNANIQEGKKIKFEPISIETEGYLILLKGFWCQIWRDFQLRHRETLSARFILEFYSQQSCPLAKASIAESILSDELKREFKKADKAMNYSNDTLQIQNMGTSLNGLFILDFHFINYCKDIGKGEGTLSFLKQFNEVYENNNFDIELRRNVWCHPLFMYRCIANIIWLNKVKSQIEALRRKPPALTYIVHEQVHKPMRNGAKFDQNAGKIIDRRGHELAIIDVKESSKTLPSMNIDIIQKILRPENIKVLSSVNAHRLLRWEIQTVTRQFVEGMIDARALKVYGGYQELANLIGARGSRKAAEQLRDIIVWQAAPRFYQANGRYGNMLSFDYTPSGHGRQAILQLVLGNMMLPHYVYELLNMTEAGVTDRRLIPIVDMPPLIGRPNDQGSQPSYQMEILVEMRKGAKEFAINGCVLIPKNKLSELAEKAGMSKRIFLKVIDRWLQDGTDAPAFLKMVEDDRYALGNHFKQAQDFIIEAGKKEIAMSKAGKKSIAKRNAGNFKS